MASKIDFIRERYSIWYGDTQTEWIGFGQGSLEEDKSKSFIVYRNYSHYSREVQGLLIGAEGPSLAVSLSN